MGLAGGVDFSGAGHFAGEVGGFVNADLKFVSQADIAIREGELGAAAGGRKSFFEFGEGNDLLFRHGADFANGSALGNAAVFDEFDLRLKERGELGGRLCGIGVFLGEAAGNGRAGDGIDESSVKELRIANENADGEGKCSLRHDRTMAGKCGMGRRKFGKVGGRRRKTHDTGTQDAGLEGRIGKLMETGGKPVFTILAKRAVLRFFDGLRLGFDGCALREDRCKLGSCSCDLVVSSCALVVSSYTLVVSSYVFGVSSYTLVVSSYVFGVSSCVLGIDSCVLGVSSYALGIDSYALWGDDCILGIAGLFAMA